MKVTISDWLIILATMLGPILAVQAQKWVERKRRVSDMRSWIFTTLMTTRANRLTAPHIEALNSITIAFNDSGRRLRSRKCQLVLDRWREYIAHLNVRLGGDRDELIRHNTQIVELFTNLLESMAAERGFEFDRVEIANGAYHPQAVVDNTEMGSAMMENALRVLRGDQAIRIYVGGQQPS
ncbi:hypothetical protein J7373_01900 [Xanthomonas sp. A2111]|uniref:DUF6680 domain-containing protein n=1 Tax=Xanthomonas hawaiiensis TaxID=3003247 RepID=A0ABU2I468_9XANT|nr:DUF6680 family protein [Xanthomonas sp. A2111]MBO9826996.1 hypothetical protein [Xanthomonas sp. A2111]MDS9992936.1 hypothetical protein [Xanthomonas sp. A2111]